MTEQASVGQPDTAQRAEQTEIVLLDEDTEQEIGALTATDPPIPAVGDLVSLQNFQSEIERGETDHDRSDDFSFRVVDRAIHYSTADPAEETSTLTTEVLLYVVSKQEWAVRRQRGN